MLDESIDVDSSILYELTCFIGPNCGIKVSV